MCGRTLVSEVQKWKAEEVEELAKLINRYPVVAVFNLSGLRASLLHEIRKSLRNYCTIRVAKKALFIKAAEKTAKKDLTKLVEDVKASIGFIFSDLSLFKLKALIDKNKILMHAKAGERADIDVVIPEMNTGLPPGPVLSDFGKLKIPTRIEGGQIWIAKDTVVAKKGDEISPLLASLLARLDIKVVRKGITIDKGYEDGVIILGEDLKIDLEETKKKLIEANESAIKLAIEIEYIAGETIQPLIIKAHREARTLAIEAGLPIKEVIEEILIKAETIARKLKEIVYSKT